MTKRGESAADGELLHLIYLHLKENGYQKAANVLKKHVVQKETKVHTTLHDIYTAWIKRRREPEVQETPVRKARLAGCTREAEDEIKPETGAAFEQVVGSDAVSRHPVVTREMRTLDCDSDSEEDMPDQKATETLKPKFTKPAVVEGTPGTLVKTSLLQIQNAPKIPAIERPAESSETYSSDESGSEDQVTLPKLAKIPRAIPAKQLPTKMGPAVPRKPSLCAPVLLKATPWTPAEGEARSSGTELGSADPATRQKSVATQKGNLVSPAPGVDDTVIMAAPAKACITSDIRAAPSKTAKSSETDSQSEHKDELPPTQVYISQPSAIPEVTGRGGTSDGDRGDGDRGNTDASEDAPVQKPAKRTASTGGTAAPVKPRLYMSTPVLAEATCMTPAVEREAWSFDSESSAESGGEDGAAWQKTLSAPKAKHLPAAPRMAVTSTPPAPVQPTCSTPRPSTTPAEAAGGDSESKSEDGLPLTQATGSVPSAVPFELKTLGSDEDMAVPDAPLTPKPQPEGLMSRNSAASSSKSTPKTSVPANKEGKRSADSSDSEDEVSGAKVVSTSRLRTSNPTVTLAGATRSTPAVEREARSLDTESSAESGGEVQAARQTITAASQVLPKRTPKARTGNLLETTEKVCDGPDSSGSKGMHLAVTPKVSSSKIKSRLTTDEEENTCCAVKDLSAVCCPTSGEPPKFILSKDLTHTEPPSLDDSGIAEELPPQSPSDPKDAPEKSGERKNRKRRKLASFPLQEQRSEDTSLPTSPSADPGTLIAEAHKAAEAAAIGKHISLEDSASKHLQPSEVAPPTEREAIYTVKTSTGEAERKTRAGKMDSPAKKKKRARCSESEPEGHGEGAGSDICQGVENQNRTWALTLSDSDTSKELPMASVRTTPTLSTLSLEKKRRRRRKKKKVKMEDVENGMGDSTRKMEKATPIEAKRIYASEANQEQVEDSRKEARKSSSLKRVLFAFDTPSWSSKRRKKSIESVASKPGPEIKTNVLKKKDKDKQAAAGRKRAKTTGSCEPVTPAGNLSTLLRVKKREKNQIKQKSRKWKMKKATRYRLLLDMLSPMKPSPEPDKATQ